MRSVGVWVCLTCVALVAGVAHGAQTIEHWRNVDDAWFATDEGRRVVDNVLSWQNANGGWWKNYDTLTPRPPEARPAASPLAAKNDGATAWESGSTFDNGATFNEIRLLARAHRVTGRADCADAVRRGLEFVLSAQYPHGGFPQRFPLQDNYGRHVTFNDNAMVGVLRVLRDAARASPDFAFLDQALRDRCRAAFDLGIDCILRCQIRVGATLTAWCQQHDAETLAPIGARTFEPPALCSTESAEIALLLMELESPDPRVRAAIESAVAWFESTKILGYRYQRFTGPEYETGAARKLIEDPAAPPLWPRLRDIKTGKPLFVDRDGSTHDDVKALSVERQAGYAWYSTAPNKAIAAYAKWKQKHP